MIAAVTPSDLSHRASSDMACYGIGDAARLPNRQGANFKIVLGDIDADNVARMYHPLILPCSCGLKAH